MFPQPGSHNVSRVRLPMPLQLPTLTPTTWTRTRRGMHGKRLNDGPLLKRLVLVLSSMSPLFILWFIRGVDLGPDWMLWVVCAVFIIVPNGYLALLWHRAVNKGAHVSLEVGDIDDRRQDIVSYLFAMLLPFYSVSMSSWRDVLATFAAFFVVVVLFVRLNLHFMNFIFALLGYHCFQVRTPWPDRPGSGPTSYMVVTRNSRLRPGDRLTVYPFSPTVMIEASGQS